jgi:hypothetical protein
MVCCVGSNYEIERVKSMGYTASTGGDIKKVASKIILMELLKGKTQKNHCTDTAEEYLATAHPDPLERFFEFASSTASARTKCTANNDCNGAFSWLLSAAHSQSTELFLILTACLT